MVVDVAVFAQETAAGWPPPCFAHAWTCSPRSSALGRVVVTSSSFYRPPPPSPPPRPQHTRSFGSSWTRNTTSACIPLRARHLLRSDPRSSPRSSSSAPASPSASSVDCSPSRARRFSTWTATSTTVARAPLSTSPRFVWPSRRCSFLSPPACPTLLVARTLDHRACWRLPETSSC